MKFHIKCDNCGATAWVRGEEDPEVNAFLPDIRHDTEWEGGDPACDHEVVTCVDQVDDAPDLLD